MKTVFISAPIAAATAEGVVANIAVAEDLARLAIARGYAPICLHSSIARGLYGDDFNPADRERGIQICCAIVRSVASDPESEIWIRVKQDGELSVGCKRELEAWRSRQQFHTRFFSWTLKADNIVHSPSLLQ